MSIRTRAVVIVLLGLAIVASTVSARTPAYKAEDTENYFTEWLFCGPFPNPRVLTAVEPRERFPEMYTDYLEAWGGEAKVKPRSGQKVLFKGQALKWFRQDVKHDGILLGDVFGVQDEALIYAYCQIKARKDGPMFLAVGSDDGVRVWLNGKEVWDNTTERSLALDQDTIPIQLNKGTNRLLLKVGNGVGGWGFSARLLPFEPERFRGERFFELRGKKGPNVSIEPIRDVRFLTALLNKVAFELHSIDGELVWRGVWPEEAPLGFELPRRGYKNYRLTIQRSFMDGRTDTETLPVGLGTIKRHVLFENGTTRYRIVLGTDASDSERWAAQELRTWLREASGVDFPIVEDSSGVAPREIVLGVNRHTEAILKKRAPAPLDSEDESFTVRNAGPHILIYGGRHRGTMYGVMDFLERQLGCRWYSKDVSVVPKRDRFEFSTLDQRDGPRLRVRNDFYYEAFDPIWAARNRINGCMSYRDQPGGVEGYWGVHTFYHFLPPSEFFESHPEYFSLIREKRSITRSQLCLTHPDVLRITIERLRTFMRSNPEYLIYSVSQNDWAGPCECDGCQAIVKREGGEAGPLIAFVNQVAEAIEGEFPDKFVGTLAYQYTRKPPKTIRPRQNVVIRLCSIECDFAHSFQESTSPTNKSFLDDLHAWAEIAPHLYIWDYVVNFANYLAPHPNFNSLQQNLQDFRDNNAIGVMEQACYNTRGGEFSELRAYVLAKLLWNPDCDVDAVIDDFMYGYYGRAGQAIREYLDFTHSRVKPSTYLRFSNSYDIPLFGGDFLFQAERMLDQAEAVADDETIRRRVEMVRMQVMYLKLRLDLARAVEDGTYERFKKAATREGVGRIEEWNPIATFYEQIDAKIEAMKAE